MGHMIKYCVFITMMGMGIAMGSMEHRQPEAGVRYVMRWETLGTNRDRPRKGNLPQNAELVLYKLNIVE